MTSPRPALATRLRTALSRAALPGPEVDLGALAVLAVWSGIATGLLEAAVVGARWLVSGHFPTVGPDFVWLAPIAYAALNLVVALLLAVVARRFPRAPWWHVAVFLFVLFAVYMPLSGIQRLAWWARLLLAAGVASQVVQRLPRPSARPEIAPEPAPALGLTRRRLLAGAGLSVAGLAVGLDGAHRLAEWRALGALPAAAPGQPNVLLIVLDTVRAASTSLHGYERKTTPRLDQFARGGTLFARAVAPAPWTLPSHGSLFTGRWVHELSTSWRNPLDGAFPTLAEFLAGHGYTTAGFVGNVTYCSRPHGVARGFVHYEDYVASLGELAMASYPARAFLNDFAAKRHRAPRTLAARKWAPSVNEGFLRWLGRRDGSRPFFAFLNYFDAHDPYDPPDEYILRFASRLPEDQGVWRRRISPAEAEALRDGYEGAIAYLDEHIGRLLDELGAMGILDNTLVIITSDHGEQVGEHGLTRHANSLYWPLLHVPLVVSLPGRVPAGQTVRNVVTLRDLPATIADFLGLRDDSPFPGASWVDAWSGRPVPDTALAGVQKAPSMDADPVAPMIAPGMRSRLESVTMGRYHYIYTFQGPEKGEQLFDLDDDPAETRNLAGDPALRSVLEDLRQARRELRRT
jgi:arylsulfatase A-like enzyme